MAAPEPYLSLVVTARNDDHGGNLLGRMQAFVNGWLNQARRYALDSELIIVEWNPPAGRPRLAEALRWPADLGPCTVRVVEVPPELHARYRHAAALPLYQMIGKNVGIRRARGRFVLATNIDILFSSELVAFLAERRLDPARMYRIDRHDAMSDVPVEADPEDQLAYCRTHLIRVNRREGTFIVGADSPIGSAPPPTPLPLDAGVLLGDGWYPAESHGRGEAFRWAGQDAALRLETAPAAARTLVLEVEPGPGTAGAPLDLEISTAAGPLARCLISRRGLLSVRTQWSPGTGLTLHAHGNLIPAGNDPRPLGFRIFRASWSGRSAGVPMHSTRFSPPPLWRRAAQAKNEFDHLIARLATEGPLVNLTVLVSPRLQGILRRYARWQLQAVPGKDSTTQPGAAAVGPEFLHTNGCGDFTLLSRERWFDLRAYPEFDLFSMNLDSVFCFAAHHGGAREEVLPDPMRIYHIEHGTGSGWTPEGQAKLFQRLAAAGLPHLDNDTVLQWGASMHRLDSPMIFNGAEWGLADADLPETTLRGAAGLPNADS